MLLHRRVFAAAAADCEYLEQHIQTIKADDATQQAVKDIVAATARLERALSENFTLMEFLQEPDCSKRTVVDLCILLRQVAAQADMIREQLGVELVLEDSGLEGCLVQADHYEIEVLGLHLLSNALRASKPNGLVQMTLHRDEDCCQLIIADEGCGLPQTENVLLENRRAFLGGAKAGLLICREICRRMGWVLELCQRPERGTRAVVTIPQKDVLTGSAELCMPDGTKAIQRQYRLRAMLVKELRTMPEQKLSVE